MTAQAHRSVWSDQRLDAQEKMLQAGFTEVKVDLNHFRTEVRTEFVQVRKEMRDGFDELRTEFHEGHDALRQEMHEGHDALRQEMHKGHDALRKEIHEVDNRLQAEMKRGFDVMNERLLTMHRTLLIAMASTVSALLVIAFSTVSG